MSDQLDDATRRVAEQIQKLMNLAAKNPNEAEAADFRRSVTVPVRDMQRGGRIVFSVDVYGIESGDTFVVPGGGAPFRKAIERLGLDSNRYQASMWEVKDVRRSFA